MTRRAPATAPPSIRARSRDVEHAHPKARRPPRHRAPDCAPSDNPQRRAKDLRPQKHARSPCQPLARADLPVALGDAPRRRQHQGERKVRGRLGQDAGGMPDRDARQRCGGEIDIVDADRQVADDAKARRRGNQRGVDSVGHHRERTIRVAKAAAKFGVRRRSPIRPDLDPGGAAQFRKRGGADRPSDENARSAIFILHGSRWQSARIISRRFKRPRSFAIRDGCE